MEQYFDGGIGLVGCFIGEDSLCVASPHGASQAGVLRIFQDLCAEGFISAKGCLYVCKFDADLCVQHTAMGVTTSRLSSVEGVRVVNHLRARESIVGIHKNKAGVVRMTPCLKSMANTVREWIDDWDLYRNFDVQEAEHARRWGKARTAAEAITDDA
jgi:hypothetical protein